VQALNVLLASKNVFYSLNNQIMKRSICRLLAWPLLLCIGISISISSCKSKNNKDVTQPEKYKVTSPLIADTVFTKEYVAEIQSVQNVELRARVKGFIEKIYVDEGQYVTAGQVLFTLSSRAFKEDLLKANAQLKAVIADLKTVEVEIKNAQILTDKNVISKGELEMLLAKKDAVQAKIEEAKSDIALANLNLSFAQVRAPFSGVINLLPNKTGSLVDEGTLLTTISNNREVYAYFNVAEKDYLDYVTSSEKDNSKVVSLVLANNTTFSHKGIIETTESEFDKSTGNIAFRAKFPNPQNLLKHGASGKVLVNTALKNAMLIPQKSTFEIQGNVYVFAVDKNNTVQMRKVVPAYRLPQLYVISSGIASGEHFIYEGIQTVKEGDKVETEPVLFSQIMKP
jgi:RND family efflux transporter MFP subunit